MTKQSNTALEPLLAIGTLMLQAGLPEEFVADAVKTAIDFEGVYDLMLIWRDERDDNERAEAIADIQELIDDCAPNRPPESLAIRFDDLEAIARDVRAFKNELLLLVNDRGGITHLANLTGMPQPSLSRFFNSESLPRRGTLLRIARALNLRELPVSTTW